MQLLEQGRLQKLEQEKLNPDEVVHDIDLYLRSVRKEAFDFDDKNVVLIDPGQDATSRYADIKLPCDQQSHINNQLTAPTRG